MCGDTPEFHNNFLKTQITSLPIPTISPQEELEVFVEVGGDQDLRGAGL